MSGLLAPSNILDPETLELPKQYSLPDPPEGVKVEAQIMQRVKGGGVHLAGQEQMPQVRARESPARIAAAGGVGRAVVLGVLRVFYIDAPLAGKQLAVPRIAGREDAVEHVHA